MGDTSEQTHPSPVVPAVTDAPAVRVHIDRRPLWVILGQRGLRFGIVGALAALLAWVYTTPPPDGLTPEGFRALGVFVTCVVLWVTHVLPLAVTSLLVLFLLPVLGVMKRQDVFALFGNDAVFFILGAFILAAAVMKTGLSNRIALKALAAWGTGPRRLVLSVYGLAAGMSCFMSEHAVAALLFPMVLAIAHVLKLPVGRSVFGKGLFIAMAWGCIIGGIATMLGGARAALAAGLLEQITGGDTFSFLTYSLAAVPVAIPVFALGAVLLLWFFPPDVDSIEGAHELVEHQQLESGRMSADEKRVAVLMAATVALWVILGDAVGLSVIALGMVGVFFLLRLVSWRDVEEYVNWGIILMYGGAICLGAAVERSGAAEWVATHTLGAVTSPTWTILGVSFVSRFLTEGISNTAVIALLVPLVVGLSATTGLGAKTLALTIAVPAGLAFSLPMSTPAVAIAFSSRYLRMRDIVIPGLVLGTLAWAIFAIVAVGVWPLMGIGGGP